MVRTERVIIPNAFEVYGRREADQTNPDNLEESSTDDLWNTFDGQTSLWKEVRIHEVPNPEQASTISVFMRGWQIDQNTSHIETRNGSARSVVIYF